MFITLDRQWGVTNVFYRNSRTLLSAKFKEEVTYKQFFEVFGKHMDIPPSENVWENQYKGTTFGVIGEYGGIAGGSFYEVEFFNGITRRVYYTVFSIFFRRVD
jgi:hypothetical protein